MTKKLKKFLATLLAMSMILSMASVSAFAADGDEPASNEPVIEDVVTGDNNENTPETCETCGKNPCECEGHEDQTDPADTSEENEEEEEEQSEEELCEHEWNEGEAVEGGTKYTCALCGETHVLADEDNSFDTDTLEENGIVPQAGISGTMTGATLRDKAVDGVITLDGDVTLTSKMVVNKDIVLDLNGHTVTATGDSYFNTIEVQSGKTLTIRDSVGGGKITDSGLTGSAWSAEGVILTKGTLNLEGGTIETAQTNCVRVGANSYGGKAVLDGAALVCNASMKSGIEIYQNAKAEATAEIKSGSITAVSYGLNVGKNHNAMVTGGTITVTGTSAHGVQVGGSCAVSLKNCTIKATGNSSVGVYAGSNKVTLEDVVVESKANAIFLNSECEVTISGENTYLKGTRVIVLNNGWSTGTNSRLIITGGTVESANCNPLKTIDLQAPPTATNVSKPEIKGGNFNTDVTAYVAEGMAQDVNGDVLPAGEVDVPMGSVAEVDGKGYTTLQAAIDAAGEGDTVTLLTDVKAQLPNNFGYAYEPVFAIEKSLTLDGAGHKITVDTANWSKYDSKITGHIFNVGVQDGHVAQAENLVVNATIKNLTIVGNAEYMRNGINAYTIRTGEAANTAKTTLNLENVNISGCGAASLEVNNSTVNVKNCDLANGGWQQAISVDKGTTNLTVESGTIGNIVFGGNGTKNNASITGGRITGVFAEEGSDEKQNIAISGGTFDTAVLPAYCAEGYVPVENNDGTYTVNEAVAAIGDVKYGTLQAAIDAAGTTAATVELLKSTTESVVIAAGQNITLDLNGKTLRGSSVNADYAAITVDGTKIGKGTVTNCGTLTIIDSSAATEEAAMGKIVGVNVVTNANTDATSGKIALVNMPNATCTIKSGMITRAPYLDETKTQNNGQTSNYTVQNMGTMNIEGGLIVNNSTYSNLVVNYTKKGNSYVNGFNAEMNISGGTLRQDTMSALKNDPGAVMNISGDAAVVWRVASENNYATNFYGTVNMTGGTIKTNGVIPLFTWKEGTTEFPAQFNISGNAKLECNVLESNNGVMGGYNDAYVINQQPVINISGNPTITVNRMQTVCSVDNVMIRVENGTKATINVEGGTFSSPVDSQYCAEGYLPIANEDGTYGVTDTLTLSQTTLNMTVGYTTSAPVPLTVTPEVEVEWTSSNPSVATVANGVVTPVAVGSTTITAVVNGLTAECVVTVRNTTAPYVPPTPSTPDTGDEDLEDPDTPLADRPWLFTDVKEGDYFYDAVKRLFDKGIVGGKSDTIYAPYEDATRGMVAQILYGMAGSPDVTGLEMPFTDVKESDFYYKAVLWGYANKVLGGYPEDNTFRGENTITREELAALLHQYGVEKLGLADTKSELDGFIDTDKISGWAVEHIKWAVGVEIMHGDNAKKLMPKDNTIRADMTIMLNNLDQMIGEEK